MELERDARTGSLGIAVIGGVEAKEGEPVGCPASRCVVVKTILPEGPAWNDGRLRCGDLLLAVNAFSLEGLSHDRVVALLKSAPTPVSLTIVSWPGTIV